MPDEQFKILITSEADNTGFTSAGRAAADLGDAEQITAEQAERLHMNHRALHAIMHMIGQQTAPELGHALTGALYGPIGIALALGYAFAGVQKYIAGMNAELDKSGAAAAQPLFDGVKHLEEEWKTVTEKVAAYTAAVANAGKDKDPIDTQIKSEEELTKARLDGIKKIIEALGQEEEANLRAQGASSEQIAAAKARTKELVEGVDEKKKAATTQALEKEYAERTATGHQKDLDDKAKASEEKAGRAETHYKNLQSEYETATKGKDGGGSAAKAEIERLEKIQQAFDAVSGGHYALGDIATIDQFAFDQAIKGRPSHQSGLTAEMNEAQQTLARENALAAQDKAQMPGAKTAADEAAIEAANAEAEGKRNAKRAAELPGLIQTGKSKNSFEDADSIITKGVAAEDAVQKSGRATDAQAQAIQKLHDLATLSGTNMTAILRILAISHAAHATQQQDIDTIKRQFEELSARGANARNATP